MEEQRETNRKEIQKGAEVAHNNLQGGDRNARNENDSWESELGRTRKRGGGRLVALTRGCESLGKEKKLGQGPGLHPCVRTTL